MRGLVLVDAERNLLRNAHAVALEGNDLFRVVGENPNILQAKINKDLRADPALVLHQALARRGAVKLSPRMDMNLRQYSGFFRRFDSKSAAGVVQVQEYPATLPGDFRQGLRNKNVAIAGCGTEHVASQTVRVHANQRRLGSLELAAHQRDMLVMIDVTGVRDHPEIAVAGR